MRREALHANQAVGAPPHNVNNDPAGFRITSIGRPIDPLPDSPYSSLGRKLPLTVRHLISGKPAMAKEQVVKKEDKKKSEKTLKEKRLEKKAKKASKK